MWPHGPKGPQEKQSPALALLIVDPLRLGPQRRLERTLSRHPRSWPKRTAATPANATAHHDPVDRAQAVGTQPESKDDPMTATPEPIAEEIVRGAERASKRLKASAAKQGYCRQCGAPPFGRCNAASGQPCPEGVVTPDEW